MQQLRILLFISIIAFGSTQAVFGQASDSLRKSMSNQHLISSKNDFQTTNRSDSLKAGGDSIVKESLKPVADTSLFKEKKHKHTPKGATIRSAIIPGWGQAYNHEYWKVPLATGGVAIPIYLFISNNKEYKKARFAYNAVFQSLPIANGGKADESLIPLMDQKFITYYDYTKTQANGKLIFLSSVQSYRNTFRQYRDYSIVATLIIWGLNVADATVFGHLRDFDVSPDLSMHIQPTYLQFARAPGISLQLNF